MKSIPICIIIDAEPDERQTDPNDPKDWEGFEKTCEYFKKLRPQLEDATGSPVHFSWFLRMDPQVEQTYGAPDWAVTRYRELIEELTAAGDELGLHPHAWRWDEASGRWTEEMSSQEWINHCVSMGFEAFRKSLNRPCLSFRFGAHWTNEETVELAERLGARFDLTVEPGQKNFFMPYSFTGSFPDYTSAPRRPYRPSKDDFRKRAAWRRRKLWMIPQSTARLDWELEPANGDNGKMDSSSGNGASARRPAGSAPLDASSVYEGHLDRVDPQMIWGWAYDATRPNEPIEVEIYADEMLVATIPASCLRPDLSAAGKGDGRHAFCIHIPNRLKDGEPHSVRVKVAGSDFELSGSPKEIHFAQGDWDEEFLLTLNTNPWVMGRAVDRLLGDLEAPYLALPVRTDVGINPIELSNMEQNLSQLMSHPLVKRFVFTTPDGLVKRVG